MQSRRDQVQAYFFVLGRLVSALVRGEPDAPETPLRRFTTAAFGGVMIGVVITAVVGILGLLLGGGGKKFEPNTIIVEKETGNRFLLIDGTLRPVLNFASAKLITGGDTKVRSVRQKSLAGMPHGQPVGIPGAPDSLPDPRRLTTGPWLICSPLVTDETGARQPAVTVQIGGDPAVAPLPDDRTMVVQTADGETYLAFQNRRLRFLEEAAVTALGYGSVPPITVGQAWVNALPAGKDLRAPDVPNRGQPGPPVGGRATRVGQVFVTTGASGRDDFFLLLADGLSPTSETDASLILGDPLTAVAYPGQPVQAIALDTGQVASGPRSGTQSVTAGFPASPPQAVQAGTGAANAPCVRLTYRTDSGPEERVAFAAAPEGVQPGGAGGADPRAADKAVIPPGGGLIARDLPAPGVGTGTLFLITDLGVKFPIPSDDVAERLGYGGVAPLLVPSAQLALLPTGPVLDPDAAAVAQPAGGRIPTPADQPGG
jgi:type VII secretion protein EccB